MSDPEVFSLGFLFIHHCLEDGTLLSFALETKQHNNPLEQKKGTAPPRTAPVI
jgi:hypothetical protein